MAGSVVLSSGTQNSQYGQTAATPSSPASAAASAIQSFLKVAPSKYYAIQGTLGATHSGGTATLVTWQQQVPIIPAFCTAIDYVVVLKVKLTVNKKVGTVNGSATLSPFAPYSAMREQLTLGGAPPWPLHEMTSWYLDSLLHKNNYDWSYPGLGNNAGYFATIVDEGPTAPNIGNTTTNLKPGTAVTNSTLTNVVHTYTFKFHIRQQLQRKRHLMWGAINMGDPENRPNNLVAVGTLVGKTPAQSLFVKAVGATTKCVTTSVKVYAMYELAYIDLLPPGVSSVPQPVVNYGLQVTPFTISSLSAGVIQPITHRTAQLYTAIHHILVNGQLPVRADYFALWDDQDQQSARWAFDSGANNFTEWFRRMQRVYRRYMNKGHYFVDMESGVFPEIPSVTPLDSLMSPDASYAQAFSVPITPAMTTAIRLPSGTTATTAHARLYSFGLVRVPY